MTDRPPPFHVALRLEGEPCLVVGAGPVAARKAASLLECGALVRVVAPDVCEAMEALVAAHLPPRLTVERRTYRFGDLDGHRLVVTATGDRQVDGAVYLDAEQARVLVNAADDPESCSFLVPAVLRSGDVSVAVSTGGVSPFLAGWVRSRVGSLLGPEIGELTRIVGDARSALRAAGVATEGCDWNGLVELVLWPLVEAGEVDQARTSASQWVTATMARAGPPQAEDPPAGVSGD